MSDSPRQSRLLADLPFDVLLKVFSECDVDDVLSFSATCKRLNQASNEHQTWLSQARRLQIPIPTDIIPSTADLKNWAISWVRSDELWVKPEDENDDRSLILHQFDLRQDNPNERDRIRFVMANFAPGGKFVVVLYTDGQIDLKEIKSKSGDRWDLQDVAQYKQDDAEGFYTVFWSQLLTETRLGRPLVAYVGQEQENLLVFLVDHVAGIIERKQVIRLGGVYLYDVYGIHARGNIILCFYEHGHGWGITVSELGPDPAMKSFNLSINGKPKPGEIQFFMVSENAVVICDATGIHLYHIPELSSMEDFSPLSPVWEWSGESEWLCGSVCMTSSQCPMLYLQGASGTHTITFRLDACGRDPVVVKHHITEKLPAYLTSLEEGGWDHRFIMKGRKGLYYNVGVERESYPGWATCLVGREELMGGFSTDMELLGDGDWEEHEVRLADFDERTGRILIGTHLYHEGQCIRIHLADLPP